ncbi:MAG: molybdopterin-dependent oxidoreductase [Acidimicrobiales bacterium]|nr:molybdopterin-dependent oxidoreductase [Acidimicrobiales bacterium]
MSKKLAALAGVASAALGLALAEFIASLFSFFSSPFLAVGDRIIDNVPTFVKNLAISLFGMNDKVVLLLSIASGLIVFAALTGIAHSRNPMLGRALLALFASAGVLSTVFQRTGPDPTEALPTLIGTSIVGVVLARLEYTLANASGTPATTDPMMTARPSDRRRFLAASGLAIAGAGALAAGSRFITGQNSVAAARSALSLPTPTNTLAPIPGAASVDAAGAVPFLTPIRNNGFYRIDINTTIPQVPVDTWTLKISGMVERPLTLTYQDLLDREFVEADITLTCVSNTVGGELMGTARWLGTRLDDLLDEAGIDPAATQIVGRSVDGYTCGFPVSALDGRTALLAVGMNGEPLPQRHGFPARLIVPGLYGYVSATKWLAEIELTTFEAFDQYWVPRGYAAEAPIKLQSRIDTPKGLQRVPAGTVPIAGVAWAQTIGIDAVEVSIDEGPWQQAEIAEQVTIETWRQWLYNWNATPGRHEIEVRAIDQKGAIQTPDRSEPLPDGATGHHTIVVIIEES